MNWTKNNKLPIMAILLFSAGCQGPQEPIAEGPQPPVANKVPHEMTEHGNTRVDDYFWMNQRDAPEVLAYLEAENQCADTVLAHTKGFQEKLFQEIVARYPQRDESPAYLRNGYYHYSRYVEGGEHPVFCRKKGSLDAPEEIILDVNELAEGTSFCEVVGLRVSPDNKMLAYGIDTLSRRQYTLHFKNLETGETLQETIENTEGDAVWANDNQTIFFTVKDPTTLRPFQAIRYRLGSPEKTVVFQEDDETFNLSLQKSKSGQYVMLISGSTLTTEVLALRADQPQGEFKPLQPRERGHEYYADHAGGQFFIMTNWEAQNFRLMKTPENATGKANWNEIVAHDPNALIETFELFEKFLVYDQRRGGNTQLTIVPHDGGPTSQIPFSEDAYSVGMVQNAELASTTIRYAYSSLRTPSSYFDFDTQTGKTTLVKEEEVVGGYDKEQYVTQRLMATAADGTQIPISLVHKKGIALDGSNPTLLYGYGSYGYTIDPSFRSYRLSLLDRGFVFAIAHVRGGQMMGRQWYEDGKLLKKMNTFTDFIACAEHLVAQKYTSPGKLFAQGGSAGGLLMGAVANLRPDLFHGILAGVPFVDVVTTMLDESIPLTTGEFDEWGNPKEKAYYDYMLSYSPYDQVKAQNYPNMLVTTGYHDSQVQYWEPAKWVAKLRAMKTDQNRLLFHCNMDAGHGGASGRFEAHRETALEFAFMLDLLGIKE